ncbi:hypothetical protein OK016_29990 [Vibrio chagasii]|nr:hypothetical protein [Vibrio chagasii]
MEYQIPVEDFKFSIVQNSHQRQITTRLQRSYCHSTSPWCSLTNGWRNLRDKKGQSVFIPAYAESYKLDCVERVARAYS